MWRWKNTSKSPDNLKHFTWCHLIRAQDKPDPNVPCTPVLPNHEQLLILQHKVSLERDLTWKTVKKVASLLKKSPNHSSLNWKDDREICFGLSGTSHSPELLCPDGLVCSVSILVMSPEPWQADTVRRSPSFWPYSSSLAVNSHLHDPSLRGNFHPLTLLLDHHTLPAATHQTLELISWLAQCFPCGLVGASSPLTPLSKQFSVTHGALCPLLRVMEVVSTLPWLLWHAPTRQRNIPGTFQASVSLVAQLMGISEQAQEALHSARRVQLHNLGTEVPFLPSPVGLALTPWLQSRPYKLLVVKRSSRLPR